MTFMPYGTLTDNAPIHPGRKPRSNRQVFRVTKSPICEYNPAGKNWVAMLSDRFHGLAVVEVDVYLPGAPSLRLCDDCARRFPRRRVRALR